MHPTGNKNATQDIKRKLEKNTIRFFNVYGIVYTVTRNDTAVRKEPRAMTVSGTLRRIVRTVK